MERPSVYLLRKSEAFLDALDLFARTASSRVTFLAQLDFWEWEVDNLLYSFEGFAERSADWQQAAMVCRKLDRIGLSARHKVLRSLKADRPWARWYGKTSSPRRGSVRAPAEVLVQVIDAWNGLLDTCEQKVLDPRVSEAIALGAHFMADLSKYRRKAPLGLCDEAGGTESAVGQS